MHQVSRPAAIGIGMCHRKSYGQAVARPGSGWLIRLRSLMVCGDSHARTVYMLLAPDVPRAHLARHPAGVNHDCRNGSFGGVPLQTQHVASSWRV